MRKAYPKYKPTGVEWLGDVPEHWQLKKLKFAFHILNGSTPESSKEEYWDGDTVWYTPEDLGINANKYISDSRRKITREGYDSIGAKIAPPDSIIISTRAPIGHLSITSTPSCTNQGCRSLVPKASISSAYYYYYLLISKINLNAIGKGTTFIELGTQGLGTYNIPVPPLPEQHAIAAFLDRETFRIDSLIAKKRRLMELLTEQRTALISRTVTKGLDSSVKLKSSGVEWLGDVPEHWELKKLKHAFHIINGSTPESSKVEYWDGDIVWYTPEDLGNNADKYISESRRKITREGYDSIGAKIAPSNSIIISTRAPIGHLSITSLPSCTNQGCRSLVPKTGFSSDYFYYYLFVSKINLNAIGKGTTFIELGTQGLGTYNIPLPPLAEQQSIAVYLDRETSKIDALSAKVTTVIERLKEFRTALISSAVTGRIDVSDTLNINVQEAV